MSKSIVNFILDVVLAVCFLAMLWTQFILRFLFPAPGEAAGWRLWGLNFDEWNWLSFGLTFVFAVLVLVHVMLHWSWVCGIVTHRLAKYGGRNWSSNPSTETLVGVAILVAILHLLGGLYLAAMMSMRPPTDGAPKLRAGGFSEVMKHGVRTAGFIETGLDAPPAVQ